MHEEPINGFRTWLSSIAGKQLSAATADSYANNAAKMLVYVEDEEEAKIANFLNTNKVGEYLDKTARPLWCRPGWTKRQARRHKVRPRIPGLVR